LVDAVDVWRTIADITDSSVNAAMPLTPLDSKSFLSVIQDPDDAMGSRTYSFSQIYQPNGQWPPACGETNWQSISNGRYKLVRIQDNSLQAPPCPPVSWIEGLVDLETDPTETTNLYPPSPALQSTYDALVGELNAITGQ
jgi:hypothetical protein